uniref:Uncharacterized protein n=1 Tax=Triticum urartu TaxID=4572 RepID=A0A8R7UTH1_TRIUA
MRRRTTTKINGDAPAGLWTEKSTLFCRFRPGPALLVQMAAAICTDDRRIILKSCGNKHALSNLHGRQCLVCLHLHRPL